MLKNYILVALRSIKKTRLFTITNIMGLAVAISAFVLLSLYIQNDLSYDKFNKNYKRIYRINQEFSRNGEKSLWSLTPSGFATAFKNEFPGIEAVRIFSGEDLKPVIKYEDQLFTASNFIYSDPSIFKIFDFRLIKGNSNTALNDPFSVVLSETESKKIFGDKNPIGEVIHISNMFDYKVTGVAADAPVNSSIQFSYIVPFSNIKDLFQKEWHWNMSDDDIFNNFFAANFHTFILLPEQLNYSTINNWLPIFTNKYWGPRFSKVAKLRLQPLDDIHFNSSYQFDFPNKASINNDYILGAIAVFILLIACVNFINILTAQSAKRKKEIGLRKVLGASRGKLILQFILEDFILASTAVLLAIIIVYLFASDFNSLTGKTISINPFQNSSIVFIVLLTWLIVALTTCIYPAFYLSSLQPASIIKHNSNRGKKIFTLKKVLTGFQFVFSIVLIISTIVVLRQYNFLKSYQPGFDKEQVVYLPINPQITKNYEAFKTQLLQEPAINYISRTNWIPGKPKNIENYSWSGEAGQLSDGFYSLLVDFDYPQTIGFQFSAGRNFYNEQISADVDGSFIINETAAKKMGWTASEAVGKTIVSPNRGTKKVIGVVKDFTVTSLHQKVDPVVMSISNPDNYSVVAVKINQSNIKKELGVIESQWKTYSPNFPFDYHFLDSDFEEIYRYEEKLSYIITLFSGLSILISCFGLLGLISYSTLEKTKEIGIRKVSGASVNNIVFMLTKEYAVMVIIANVIAYPLAFFLMNKWLEDFAYRINIAWWMFALSGGIALVIALLTVSYQAIKAAVANPVESLRYE